MATKNLFPAIRPSLNLDFTKGFVDPRITFTRASTATRVNSKGLLEVVPSGVPRIDYDPVTRAPKGLLIEEQRTNLLTYSEQFDNAAWLKTRSTILADSVASPDGASSADKLVESTEDGSHYLYRNYSTVSGTAYAWSCFVKAAGRDLVYVSCNPTAGAHGHFNLATGIVTAEGASAKANIVSVGAGWYRVSVSFTATITGSSLFVIGILPSSGYPGDGTSGIYLWGAQLEAGSFPTSYIPTTTAAATRATDVAVMTGANFSSWYRQDEGSFYAEGMTSSTSQVLVAADDGSMSNRYQFTIAGSYTPSFAVAAGGAISADLSTSSAEVGSLVKSAGAYRANDFALSANGGVAKTDTSGVLPTSVSNLRLGAWSSGAGFLNGHIRRITYYPRRLSNAELQALTA